MSSNTDYWVQREQDWLEECEKEEKSWNKAIDKIYTDLSAEIQEEVERFILRFGSAEGMDMATARRYLSATDIQYYASLAEKYCKQAHRDMADGTYSRDSSKEYFTEQANAEMRRYNAAMKISRLQMLQSQLALKTFNAQAKTNAVMETATIKRAESEFRRQAGILGETVLNNLDMAETLAKASFHGATFSERIWGSHQNKLQTKLNKAIRNMLILGKGAGPFTRELSRDLGVTKREAQRLLTTELARVQVQAQMESMIEAGFDQYTFITNPNCCDDCRVLNGKHFSLQKDKKADKIPPIHPNCRCTTAAYVDEETDDDFDEEAFDQWSESYDEHGLTWEEWNDALRIDGEREKRSKRDQAYSVDWQIVNSAEYRKKFSMLFEDEIIADRVYKKSIDILKHRDGTDFEDMYLIDPETKKVVASQTKTETIPVRYESDRHQHVIYNQEMKRAIKKSKPKTLITIHNHPESYPPSGSDFSSAFRNEYGYGIIACHNGDVYGYKVGKRQFSGRHFDLAVEKNRIRFGSIDVAYKITLDDFQKEYGLTWMKL